LFGFLLDDTNTSVTHHNSCNCETHLRNRLFLVFIVSGYASAQKTLKKTVKKTPPKRAPPLALSIEVTAKQQSRAASTDQAVQEIGYLP